MHRELARRPSLLLLLLMLFTPARSHAEPPVLALSGIYESPYLAVPVVVLAFPGEEASFKLAQVGWTSAAETLLRVSPRLFWLMDASATPRFAHSSNRVYRAGEQVDALQFRATLVQGTMGVRWAPSLRALTDLRVGILREWVSELPAAALEMWRRPYGFVQLSESFAFVRSDDRYRARWDGLKAEASVQGYYGDTPFVRGQASLGVGRKRGPLFVQLTGAGTYVSTRNLVLRTLVGGSWDVLGGQALHGHPFAEFRASRTATGSARVDLALGRVFELGVRASAGLMDDAFHHGAGVVLGMLAGGVYCFVGAATPDAELSRTLLLAGFSAATFL